MYDSERIINYVKDVKGEIKLSVRHPVEGNISELFVCADGIDEDGNSVIIFEITGNDMQIDSMRNY